MVEGWRALRTGTRLSRHPGATLSGHGIPLANPVCWNALDVASAFSARLLIRPLQYGRLPRLLRRGNRGSANYWRRVLPVIERYRGLDTPKFFRGDAAFAGPKLLRMLEWEGFHHATRGFFRETPCNRLPAVVASSKSYSQSPRALERPTAVRPGAVSRRASGAA
jgi:hypothetical protein